MPLLSTSGRRAPLRVSARLSTVRVALAKLALLADDHHGTPVLDHADAGDGPVPEIFTTSYTLEGETRRWTTPEAFMQEVAEGRIYDGVHFRNSTEVGTAMGRKIGELAANTLFTPAQ